MQIRLGREEDIKVLAKLYDEINDYLASTINYPGWIKGIYPTQEDAENGVQDGCLFVAIDQEEIVGSVILRQEQEPAYRSVTWQMELEDKDVYVIHTFVVDPKKLKQGIGASLLAFASQYGRFQGAKALRLDVYQNNMPAISLYEKSGYQYIDTVSLGLEEYGLDWFRLYEKLL